MNENQEVFEYLKKDGKVESRCSGSGIPNGFDFNGGLQIFHGMDYVDIYPSNGGMIRLYLNGTWEADAAPFSD